MIETKDIKELGRFIFQRKNFMHFIIIILIAIYALTVSWGWEKGKFYFKVIPISSPFTKCQ
jgi:hypothetical protein